MRHHDHHPPPHPHRAGPPSRTTLHRTPSPWARSPSANPTRRDPCGGLRATSRCSAPPVGSPFAEKQHLVPPIACDVVAGQVGEAFLREDLDPRRGHRRRTILPAISNLGIAEPAVIRDTLSEVSTKKNAVANPGAQAPVKARVIREIRLQPSRSDYETFARTTALAMGKTVRSASAPKPNTRLLSLLNLGV